MEFVSVAVGGAIGAVTRYVVSGWAASRWGGHFPYGTLLVNVVGCFLIGLIMVLLTERLNVGPYWRLILVVGFLGGLTTFSSFGLETVSLFDQARWTAALGNVALNVVVGCIATFLGMIVGRLG